MMDEEKKTTGQEQIDDEITDADLMYIDDEPDYWHITDVYRLRQLIDYAYKYIYELESDIEDKNAEIASLKEKLVDKIVEDEL